MKLKEEESINEKLIKRIKYLEYINLYLAQTNKNLTDKLYNVTKKYNDLKNELYDIECHINFCKKNLTELVSFKQENKEKKDNNFLVFKHKIKTLFNYGDDFMKTNSETTVYNMIIDNIRNIIEENISLRKNFDELNKVINQRDENDNYIPSSISNQNYNNSQTTEENKGYNNYEHYSIQDNNNYELDDEIDDDDLLIYQNNDEHYNHRLYHKYI